MRLERVPKRVQACSFNIPHCGGAANKVLANLDVTGGGGVGNGGSQHVRSQRVRVNGILSGVMLLLLFLGPHKDVSCPLSILC